MELTNGRRELIRQRLRQACIAANGREHGIATFLAEQVGVSPSTAAKWLGGRVMPDPDRWGVIAAALGVSAAWLVGASHETPEHLIDVDQQAADNVGMAARIVFPLVYQLRPNLPEDVIAALTRQAYEKLVSGEPENAVSGDIAQQLMQQPKN